MLGRATLMAPDGKVHEYAVYNDYRDIVHDMNRGDAHDWDEIVYRSMVCAIVGMFADEFGAMYTELMPICTLNGFTFIINQGGPQAYAQA